MSLKGIDLYKIDGTLLPTMKIVENLFIWYTRTYKNYQKYYVGCAWISTGNSDLNSDLSARKMPGTNV